MRVAVAFATMAAIVGLSTTANCAKLVIIGVTAPTDGLGGVSVRIGVDTEDTVTGFLGYQNLLFEGAIHQQLANPAFFPPAGNVNRQDQIVFADLASPVPGNFTVNDTYWLANGLAPTGTGFVGGGVGEPMGFTGAHTALPVNVPAGIVPLINVRYLSDGFYPISGIIARIDDQGGYWVNGQPRDQPLSGCPFGVYVSGGQAGFPLCPEPSTYALAGFGVLGALLMRVRSRRRATPTSSRRALRG